MAKGSGNYTRAKIYRSAWWPVVLFVLVVLVVILIVYLVLRPSKPKFYLQNATILTFNLSAPNLLSSYLQVTLTSRNPNDRVGIYYDSLDVYASYKNQQITQTSSIVPHYQGHKDVDVWSPYLRGDIIPIAPFLVDALVQDEADGFFFLWVKIEGRVRWKVGTWRSGHYHLFVNCPAYLSFDRSKDSSLSTQDSSLSTRSIKFRQTSTCSVDI